MQGQASGLVVWVNTMPTRSELVKQVESLSACELVKQAKLYGLCKDSIFLSVFSHIITHLGCLDSLILRPPGADCVCTALSCNVGCFDIRCGDKSALVGCIGLTALFKEPLEHGFR